MFPLGHFGITAGVVRVFDRKADLRAVALWGVAADLIDKPIGLLYPEAFGNNTRLAAHSLIACLVMTAGLAIARRRVPQWRSYAASYWIHMVLDRMWRKREIPIFFWPFLGKPGGWDESALKRWHTHLVSDHYTRMGEIIGLTILTILFIRHKLYKIENLKAFAMRGELQSSKW